MLTGSTYFTMEAYPGDQRAAAWRLALAQLSLQTKGGANDGPIHASVRSIVSPLGISFARITGSPQEFSGATQRGEDGLWLALHLEGHAELISDAGPMRLAPGDIAFGLLKSAFGIACRTDFQGFFVKIPHNVLSARLINPQGLRATLLPGRCGIGRVFAALLASVADSMEKLSPEQLRPVEITLTEFLTTALFAQPRQNLRGATSTQMSILNRICQLIESRLGESELSLAMVADAEGISARYVQKLFENAGDNFAHYVRLRRLERCRADLVNPLYAHLSITDMCFHRGFNEAAHFSRAFREQYGTSPRAYRKAAMLANAKSALSQIGRGWPEGADKALRKLTTGHTQEWNRESRVQKSAKTVQLHRLPVVTRTTNMFGTATLPSTHHYLPANDKTVHWGYFSRSLPSALTIESGDIVTVETLTHHANDDYERMIKGDPGAESVFAWSKQRKAVNRRGAGPLDASIYGRGAGEGFGVHLCTGPIAIKGAEPGDVIEVQIRDVHPRYCANPAHSGRAFGSNAATWWGFHYKELLTEPKAREVITIYEIDCTKGAEVARAAYNFRWTPQRDPSGVLHPTIDYPGIPVDHTTIKKNYDILKNVRIPLRPHFGVLALAPKEAEIVDSIPPSYFGGNLDNWRAGSGSTIYLPVSVPGGLFSVGDPHASQGDSELCGTAIECSLTGEFQFVLHKKHDLIGKPLSDLDYPLLETAQEWVVHGFSYANYLAELGDLAQSEIYKRSSLDPAMRDAFRKMRRFLMLSRGLSEDEAISLMSVAVDFGVTQVVDGNWCVHALLRKCLFDEDSD
jgi:acetamidase/formamidase/AraC-like DNA-binding protein